jgi:hypothetical protein
LQLRELRKTMEKMHLMMVDQMVQMKDLRSTTVASMDQMKDLLTKMAVPMISTKELHLMMVETMDDSTSYWKALMMVK